MVFLSTLQVLFGHSRPRSVFVYGLRTLTQHILVMEIVMGFFFVFPLSILVAALTIRMAAAGWRPSFARSDLWTTMWITIVGDALLEILLPSLQCMPLHDKDSVKALFFSSTAHAYFDTDIPLSEEEEQQQQLSSSFWLWLKQMWGFSCPTNMDRSHLFTADAGSTVLTIRLIFMCLGVYLGESFFPICLTGGIATGKSTVARLLVDPKGYSYPRNSSTAAPTATAQQQQQQQQPGGRTQRQRGRHKKTASSSSSSAALLHTDHAKSQDKGHINTTTTTTAEDEEGSFYLIDTDSIGHEILLPPDVLARGEGPSASGTTTTTTTDATNKLTTTYTVHPNDSVYPEILKAFDGYDILDEQQKFIDRRKLGAIIFADHQQRRQLNRLTHPRILLIMLKRIFYGLFWSNQDIVCVDVPLLYEKGQLRWLFGMVICVGCSPETQYERLRQRNPDLTPEQCRERIASQIPIEEKMHMADIVIRNDGNLQALAEEVERVRRDIMGRVYGIGMNLLQMLLLVGGSLSLAASSKMYSWWT